MDIPTFSCTHWALGSEMIAYVDCDKNYPDHSDLLGPVLIGGKRYVARASTSITVMTASACNCSRASALACC